MPADGEDGVDRLVRAARHDADRSRLARRGRRLRRRACAGRLLGAVDFVGREVDLLDVGGIEEPRQERRLAARQPFAALAGGDGIRQADGDDARDVIRLPALRAPDQRHATDDSGSTNSATLAAAWDWEIVSPPRGGPSRAMA